MTRFFSTLAATLILFGASAVAQEPAALPAPLPSDAHFVGQPARPPAVPMSAAAFDAEPCPRCCKTCVPECVTKKIEKVSYGVKCVEFCLPKCPGARSYKDCQGCEHNDCPRCGQVRTKKVLIKKITTIECETTQCVPR